VTFKKGDRVISLSLIEKEYKGFQLYALAPEYTLALLPASVSFDVGAAIPLAFATAAQGVLSPGHLSLARPSTQPDPTLKDKKVLVWGGSSSVGAFAVQLAVHAGYTVVSTASPHNHDLVRSLGAAGVFDHSGADVVQKIHAEFGKDGWVGAYLYPPSFHSPLSLPLYTLYFDIVQVRCNNQARDNA
jgi:NADPH:quinone reductase-like Zn-dependent oxidoreductase